MMNQGINDSSFPEKKGVTPSTLRRVNIRAVLDVMRVLGASSRAELTRRTGVSAPTMSKLLDDLIREGLVEKAEDSSSGKGRPSRYYRLTEKNMHVIGAVVELENCTVYRAGINSKINLSVSFKTPDNYEEFVRRFRKTLGNLLEEEDTPCFGFGLCVPGLVNQNENRVMLSPNLRYLDGKTPGLDISEGLGLDAVTLNDVQALCLAEQAYAVPLDVKDFAVLELRGGLGLGIMSNGQFLSGHSGYAGEFGHITVDPDGKVCGCGNRGCLETVATDGALARAVSEKAGRSLTISEIIEQVQAGDLDIDEEIENVLKYLAIGIAATVNIFNPGVVIIHAQLFDIKDGIFEKLEAYVKERALAPSMEQCRLLLGKRSIPEGTVIGINNRLFESIGPHIVR